MSVVKSESTEIEVDVSLNSNINKDETKNVVGIHS